MGIKHMTKWMRIMNMKRMMRIRMNLVTIGGRMRIIRMMKMMNMMNMTKLSRTMRMTRMEIMRQSYEQWVG